ncbi:MAG: UDP-glucose:(heptosyl)LPS alpha-1,3-glucosyltransferase [Chlamydiales bacterium]|jgi:UDP-glucose:(heptosyl)LPS alpha-1,3-glucosyltransferase
MPYKNVVILKSNLSSCGGIEKYTLRTAQAFVEKGCKVTLLTSGDKTPATSEGIEVISLCKPKPLSVYNIWDFDRTCQKWLKQNPADVIFGMDRNTYQTHYRAGDGVHAAYLKRRSKDVSFLKKATFSINPLHKLVLNIEQQAYEDDNLRCLFTNSEMVRKEVLEHYKIKENKVSTVHNGVEWYEMQSDFDQWESKHKPNRNSLSLDPHAFQFLFIGNGFRRKGLHLFLKGLSQQLNENWQLSVVGKDKETLKFQNLARTLGIAEKVKFFGPQENTIKFYQQADSLVIPSIYDPFANVTVEALAMGLFVISSKGNGGHEVLLPKNGVVIEELMNRNSVEESIKHALKHKKTKESADFIRNSVKNLDFAFQLGKIVQKTLNTLQ